jgi:hypothetical protein
VGENVSPDRGASRAESVEEINDESRVNRAADLELVQEAVARYNKENRGNQIWLPGQPAQISRWEGEVRGELTVRPRDTSPWVGGLRGTLIPLPDGRAVLNTEPKSGTFSILTPEQVKAWESVRREGQAQDFYRRAAASPDPDLEVARNAFGEKVERYEGGPRSGRDGREELAVRRSASGSYQIGTVQQLQHAIDLDLVAQAIRKHNSENSSSLPQPANETKVEYGGKRRLFGTTFPLEDGREAQHVGRGNYRILDAKHEEQANEGQPKLKLQRNRPRGR